MWRNPAVQRNCAALREWGVNFVGPGTGRLACGDNGEGRMAEVQKFCKNPGASLIRYDFTVGIPLLFLSGALLRR